MAAPDAPWPAVPQAFEDETFGSWFGRLALRYRIDVDKLATQAGVELDFGPDCSRWLATPPLTGPSLRRLAALCRVNLEDLRQLGAARDQGDKFWFCEKCFFLNPEDVTAPYWKAEWLQRAAAKCSVCDRAFDSVSPRVLSRRRNLRSLQHFISKRRLERTEVLSRMHPYTRFVRGLKGSMTPLAEFDELNTCGATRSGWHCADASSPKWWPCCKPRCGRAG